MEINFWISHIAPSILLILCASGYVADNATMTSTMVVTTSSMALTTASTNPLVTATCTFQPGNSVWGIVGTIFLRQPSAGCAVALSGSLSGFDVSYRKSHGIHLHGIHVHTNGDVSNKCGKVGAHFNPQNITHGGPNSTTSHAGDLGNILVNDNGEVNINIVDWMISLLPGSSYSILNRSIVINSGQDDLGLGNFSDSVTTGHSGDNIACCAIVREPIIPMTNPPTPAPTTGVAVNAKYKILGLFVGFLVAKFN